MIGRESRAGRKGWCRTLSLATLLSAKPMQRFQYAYSFVLKIRHVNALLKRMAGVPRFHSGLHIRAHAPRSNSTSLYNRAWNRKRKVLILYAQSKPFLIQNNLTSWWCFFFLFTYSSRTPAMRHPLISCQTLNSNYFFISIMCRPY